MLAGLFWDAVDSFASLFDRFYYIFTGESTSKADKFDNLRSMKILNTPLTQKSPGIRIKRPEQEKNLQTKKGGISQPSRMSWLIILLRLSLGSVLPGLLTSFPSQIWVSDIIFVSFFGDQKCDICHISEKNVILSHTKILF